MMSQYLVDRIRANPNIDVITEVEVSAVAGSTSLEGISLTHVKTGAVSALAVEGMFIFIGVKPRG
jgi:thioredoxin reductase (NADPH)